jgi:hypothetical protein
MLDHSCQVQRHALRERKDDLYETPVVAVEALLRVEQLPHRLWDPCCGPGNIVNVLRAAGHEVFASDLADYGDPTHFYRRDFLMERKAPDGREGVVMNPPFKLAEEPEKKESSAKARTPRRWIVHCPDIVPQAHAQALPIAGWPAELRQQLAAARNKTIARNLLGLSADALDTLSEEAAEAFFSAAIDVIRELPDD